MTSRWLRLIRIHTASLTQPVVLLGLILANTFELKRYFFFSFFAVIYHAAGFVHNDICDYERDKEDHTKNHFPLISGEISLIQARILAAVLTLITLILGIVLSRGHFLSLLFLINAVVFGVIYNIRSKKDIFSPLYITIAFVSLPFFSYYAHAVAININMIWIVLYLTFLMLFQIGVEGYLKDISSDQISLLYRLGTVYTNDGTVKFSLRTKYFAWGLRIPIFILFYVIGLSFHSSLVSIIAGSVFLAGNSWALWKLLQSGFFDKNKRVRLCALIEVLTYSQLVFALQGLLSWSGALLFIGYPYVWFMVFNRLTWKTWMTPRV